MLFAPADPQRFAITPATLGMPLACPSTLVASTSPVADNHPWLHGINARQWADAWGARFVDAGTGPGAGDIPGWGLGQHVLEQHVEQLGQRQQPAAKRPARLTV